MKLAGLLVAARSEIKSGEKNVQRNWKGSDGEAEEEEGLLAIDEVLEQSGLR